MNLSINSTSGLIGVDRIPGRFEIKTEHPRLEIKQKHAKVDITTELPKVEIDQYEAFASAGLKNISDLTREASQMAYQQAMQYIAKVAQDGDRLAAIENGGNPLIEFAERDAYPEKEFNIDYIPKARPKINVTGSISIQAGREGEGIHNGVEFNPVMGSVSFNNTKTQVNIYMKRYPSIDIKFIGNNIDTRI